MSKLTTVSVTKEAAGELRLARLDMSAAERRDLSTTDVLRRLIQEWRERHSQRGAA